MTELAAHFVDRTGIADPDVAPWPSIVVRRAEIEAEIERLANLPVPVDGRRRSLIVHPHADALGAGFTPGIRVTLEVLAPGESTAPFQQNGALVGFAIAGEGGAVTAAGETVRFANHDVWSVPSMAVHSIANPTGALQARLMFDASPLLEKLRVAFTNPTPALAPTDPLVDDELPRDPYLDETVPLASADATIRSYEALVSPEVVAHRPTLWTWAEAKRYLDPQEGMGGDYRGRMVSMLSSRLTGRTMGTTNTLTAFLSVLPAGLAHKPHRHTATAINYHFAGRGHSVIGGRTLEWEAGDLLLGAPGMETHFHASGDEKVYALTVQDNALHLAMNTDLWYEDLKQEPILVGAQRGFSTNRAELNADH